MGQRSHPPLNDLKPILGGLSRLVQDCGHQEFSSTLLTFLSDLIDVDHLSIFIFDQQLVPHLVAAESAEGVNLAKKAGTEYESGLSYRFDPNTSRIQNKAVVSDRPLLLRLRESEISNEEYRESLYRRYHLLERLSIIDQINGCWFVLNLYRDVDTGAFSDEAIDIVEGYSELVCSLLEKNFTLMPPSVWQAATRPTPEMLESLVESLNSSLSRREIEVSARALLGMTNTGIGLALGIQAATVATLRKRAYSKLNISGLNELFALCLSRTVDMGDRGRQ